MSRLIKFYLNLYPINGKKYFLNDIIETWDDYKLETSQDYINWLFPSKCNTYFPILTNNDIKKFQTNFVIRKNVLRASLRMLFFYGFVLDNKKIVKQIKPLNRRDRGVTIGLFSIQNYKRLENIMTFLQIINMEFISGVFYLALCNSFTQDAAFLHTIITSNVLNSWMATQSFLTKDSKNCNITGLNYTGNSCYMDSALMAIFAIPNTIIQDNILNKNLDILKNSQKRLWSSCDIQHRKNIQKALNEITMAIRNGSNKYNNVKDCSNLRKMLSKCPASQSFHKTDTQDSGEFLTYLFNLFQVDVATCVRKTYGSNDMGINPKWTLISLIKDNESSPIIDVTSSKLQEIYENYNILNFIEQTLDSYLDKKNVWIPNKQNPSIFYTRRKEIFKMIKSPLVIFNINRTYGEILFHEPQTHKEKILGKGKFAGLKEQNIWKRIFAPETLIINKIKLFLSSIIVHTGGAHYVTNFKCNGEWYWYDDNPQDTNYIIKHVGSYENMIKTSPEPFTHGTIFFYT